MTSPRSRVIEQRSVEKLRRDVEHMHARELGADGVTDDAGALLPMMMLKKEV